MDRLVRKPAKSANEITANDKKTKPVEKGEACGKLTDLVFRDPDNFKGGELHNNYPYIGRKSLAEPLLQSREKYLNGSETRFQLHLIFVTLKETLKGVIIIQTDHWLKHLEIIRHASPSCRKHSLVASNGVQYPLSVKWAWLIHRASFYH